MHDAMSHKFEEGRWMCEVVSVWPQARNNSGVRVKGMNLSSTHLGVGAPRRALIRCVGGHGRCDRVGAMSNPPPDAPLRFTCTVSVGDRKEQQPRSDTRCQPPHTRGGKRVQWRDGGATIDLAGSQRPIDENGVCGHSVKRVSWMRV
jgi:hypothetical protein